MKLNTKRWHFVEFDNIPSAIMELDLDEFPKGWTSISRGYLTKRSLQDELHILTCANCGNLTEDITRKFPDSFTHMRGDCCFLCNFWYDILSKQSDRTHVIDGSHYAVGDEVPDTPYGDFPGFGGRKFTIKRLKDGVVTVTTNLWHQGKVPAHFKDKLPETSIFL